MRIGALLLIGLLPGCTYFAGDHHVVITSEPQGAEIILDGFPTGFTTPAKLNIGGIYTKDHVITLRKPGYEDEVRHVINYTDLYTSRWVDGATAIELWPGPLFWTTGDFFLPFAAKWRFVPHELYVVLYAEGQAPVTIDPELSTESLELR